MANFNAHLVGGAVVSGFAASAMAYSTVYSLNEAIVLWVAGTIGGVLPDIDADSSVALSWIFTLLAFVAALVVLQFAPGQSLVTIWVLMLGIFVGVRFGIMQLFLRLTRHRGAYHSCVAAVFTALCVSYVSLRYLHQDEALAWALGGFVLLGFMTHLVLDECYAIDVVGARVKRSFGSAIKPFSLQAWWASLLFGGGSYLLWEALPSPAPFVDAVTTLIMQPSTWHFAWLG
ncbi:metal-dependent hydrolase [Allohahella marinimesophila]|uniref:Metal-dependent hydrolase n=1 Tax=Allohahella marinimesophila TaxID=1054972 RepID=A0ABP7PIU8_9GAMM